MLLSQKAQFISISAALNHQWKQQLHSSTCTLTHGNNIFAQGGCSAWLQLSAWKVEDRGFEHHAGLQVSKKQNVSSPLTRKYCEELPWPWGSFLDLRLPGLEFWILCLEGIIIPLISPSSGNSPGPASPYVHKSGLKPHSFYSISWKESLHTQSLLETIISPRQPIPWEQSFQPDSPTARSPWKQ